MKFAFSVLTVASVQADSHNALHLLQTRANESVNRLDVEQHPVNCYEVKTEGKRCSNWKKNDAWTRVWTSGDITLTQCSEKCKAAGNCNIFSWGQEGGKNVCLYNAPEECREETAHASWGIYNTYRHVDCVARCWVKLDEQCAPNRLAGTGGKGILDEFEAWKEGGVEHKGTRWFLDRKEGGQPQSNSEQECSNRRGAYDKYCNKPAGTTKVFWQVDKPVLGVCEVTGDPHIKTFDRTAKDQHFYDYGDYWLVKSSKIWVQARYYSPTRDDGRASIQLLGISQPGGANKFVVVPDIGKETEAVEGRPFGGLVKTKQSTRLTVFDFKDLEVKVEVYTYTGMLNAIITHWKEDGMSGHCGNFNGNGADDVPPSSNMVSKGELLFQEKVWTFTHPSAQNCPEVKKKKAVGRCYKCARDLDVTKQLKGALLNANIEDCVIDYCNAEDESSATKTACDGVEADIEAARLKAEMETVKTMNAETCTDVIVDADHDVLFIGGSTPKCPKKYPFDSAQDAQMGCDKVCRRLCTPAEVEVYPLCMAGWLKQDDSFTIGYWIDQKSQNCGTKNPEVNMETKPTGWPVYVSWGDASAGAYCCSGDPPQ